MAINKTGIAVAAAAAILLGGGSAVAFASSNDAAGSTSVSSALGYGPSGTKSADGTSQQGGRGMGGRGMGGHAHTAVTGDELVKVTAAVKAKDSTITVSNVQKDPDGSYDVHATKAGANVMLEVSSDLKTITERTGGPGGGRGGHAHTAVTGDELAKVTAAVKAKDSTITVSNVQKDPDGSYDVHATKAGANVMLEVSADLKTITENTGGPGGGKGGGMGGSDGTAQAPTAPSAATTSSAA